MTAAAVPPQKRFQPDARLHNRGDFELVYAAARKAWGRGFTVFIAANPHGQHRLGLAVGRKVGKAVLRNRIKRRLREVFRLCRQDLPGCYDIVVHGRAEVAAMPFAELTGAFQKAVRTAVAGKSRRGRSRRRQETSR